MADLRASKGHLVTLMSIKSNQHISRDRNVVGGVLRNLSIIKLTAMDQVFLKVGSLSFLVS